MDHLLDTAFKRFTFFTIILSLITVAIIVKFFVFPHEDAFTHSLLDNIISGLIISGVVTTTFLILSNDRFKIGQIRIIDPWKSNSLHKAALQSTSFWYSQGHYAKWVRSVALPALKERSRSEVIDARISIINPFNSEICREYVRYRNAERDAGGNKILSIDELRCELFATIVSACLFHHDGNRLSVKIYVSDYFSVPRIDVNDSWMAITHLDTRTGPILFPKDTAWYNIWMTALYHSWEQSKEIDLSSCSGLECDISNSDPDSCRNIIELACSDISHFDPVIISDENMKRVSYLLTDTYRKYV